MTLQAALHWANRGFVVFPCRDKKPLTEHGFKDASGSGAQIRAWWTQWPDAGIGLPTGKVNSLAVVDVDDSEALEAFQRDHGRLPETKEAITPRGGRHLYFRYYPEGGVIRSVAAFMDYNGLDIRGNGGYVVVPPTPGYAWEVTDVPVADAPPILYTDGPPKAVSRSPDEPIPKGARHDWLVRVSGKLRAIGLGDDARFAAIRAENESRCFPPLPEYELLAIFSTTGTFPVRLVKRRRSHYPQEET